MAVPEEVKKVPRPVNTTVYDACRDGPKAILCSGTDWV